MPNDVLGNPGGVHKYQFFVQNRFRATCYLDAHRTFRVFFFVLFWSESESIFAQCAIHLANICVTQ